MKRKVVCVCVFVIALAISVCAFVIMRTTKLLHCADKEFSLTHSNDVHREGLYREIIIFFRVSERASSQQTLFVFFHACLTLVVGDRR